MTKVLMICLALLTGSIAFGQGTIEVPVDEAIEAVRNKQRVESLTNELQQAEIKLGIKDKIINSLKSELSSWELDNKLLKDNYDIAITRIESLQKKENPGYSWNDFKNDALIFFGGAVAALVVLISI